MPVAADRLQALWTRWSCILLTGLLIGMAQAQAQSKMGLLLPDGVTLADARVSAWTDAAKEQGYSMSIVRNADFQRLGAGIRATYSGIIIPDQTQVSMSDALVSTIQSYVTQGGNILLVYDAGALNAAGFYVSPKSRFSDMVGVDYVLYEQLRDRTIGLGSVTSLTSTLRSLLVGPGKSMAYTGPTTASTAASTTTAARSATNTSPSAYFLPASPANPNGLAGHDHTQYFKPRTNERLQPGGRALIHRNAVQRERVSGATPPGLNKLSDGGAQTNTLQSLVVSTDVVHAISGYVYGPLSYPSFVTQGVAQGTVLMASPDHGLVASTRAIGAGKVLFVNLPLTYLKLSEDAMPLHGFLHLFAREVLRQPRLTTVPEGMGGLVFNWHLDSNDALQPMQALKDMGVWTHQPFSMDMTAGPDTIVIGDKLGFDLPNNPVAQQFLKDFVAAGHEVGSHGGWIHDYYGFNANETNAAEFQPYLDLNRKAIEAVTGRPILEYSAPQGNNPLWALNWLVNNGVGSYYSLSHTGTGPVRTYRGGQLIVPSLWTMPLMPFGVAATFEEFSELGMAQSELTQWYTDLIDFAVSNATTRLIYAHPPGAMLYPTVMTSMLDYARQKQQANQFRWYTMSRLANFMTTRSQTVWESSVSTTGRMRVTASHPNNLNTLTWAYAKNRYARPVVISGNMSVIDHGGDWLVRAKGGRSVVFEAAAL